MKTLSLLSAFTICCVMFGCQKAATTTPEAEPEHSHALATLAEGVEQIKGFQNEVKAAFDAGTPHECDNALHEVGHVLKAIPSAGDVSSLSEEDQKSVQKATDDLFALFLRIHEGFHGVEEVQTNAYEAVADEMNAALETLSSMSPSPSE